MDDFDDFDWVDHPSERRPGQADPSGAAQSRDYAQSGGSGRSSGSARSQGSNRSAYSGRSGSGSRSGSVSRSSSGSRSGSGSRSRATARPRRSAASRLGKGLRGLPRKIARLPRPVLIALGALIFLIVLSMVIDSALYYNKIHAGVNVAQQGVGGQSHDEAVTFLTEKVEEARTQPITLVSGGKTWTVTPDDVGQAIDIEATVSAAVDVTRRSNLIADMARRLKLYFNGEEVPLVGTVDETKLDAFLAQVAGELDVKPVNAGLVIQADLSIAVVEGVSGFVVDQDTLRQRLMDALFLHDTTELDVPMMRKAPDVMAEDSDEAIAQVESMISAGVQLDYPGFAPVTPAPQAGADPQTTTTVAPVQTLTTLTRTFAPAEIAAYMDFKAEDKNGVMTLVPYLSADKMSPFLTSIEGPMTVAAVDANLTTDGANVWVNPMVEGSGLDHEATAAALTEAALRSDDRTAEAIVKAVDPEVTTDDLVALNITDMLATYTAPEFWGTNGRQINVIVGTGYASNHILAPGEEYNFADAVGPRTPERGFTLAYGIEEGELRQVYGGGICQVSTTLFGAVYRAGLEVTERWNHSMFIPHYETGLDATITTGGAPKNLKFVNNTGNSIWIYGISDGGHTTFSIFGKDDGRYVTYETAGPYDVTKFIGSSTVTDPTLPFDSTSVVFGGQDAMKYKVTRHIEWPDGSTTTDTLISEFHVMARIVAVPTSTTTTTTTLPKPTTTTTGATSSTSGG